MRIFFFTTVFSPSVGGIEKLVELLCEQFVRQGHEVRLATLTPGTDDDARFSFPIMRNASAAAIVRLVRWCDVHVQANVSLRHAWPILLSPRRSLYQHNSVYQRDDGTLSGPDIVKRGIARYVPGIGVSQYVARKLGCAYAVLNAYDDDMFKKSQTWGGRQGDLVFLGRLVSQKGCITLLQALHRLRLDGLTPILTVIGDGPDRISLAEEAQNLGIAEQVRFAGTITGSALAEELNRHRIFVAPSLCEETFGIVALEALGCGCLPVVSERGGLVEAIGPHGITFPNGDAAALADRLALALNDTHAAERRLEGVQSHLDAFRAPAVAARYLDVFERVIGNAR